jgi:hypothetical protein
MPECYARETSDGSECDLANRSMSNVDQRREVDVEFPREFHVFDSERRVAPRSAN